MGIAGLIAFVGVAGAAGPDGAGGAAARVKADEARAAAKIADLGYLATKNCKRYPEAEAALISGLRADSSEGVRLAAADALARGCCITPKTAKALAHAAAGSDADGGPAESSARVRAVALAALVRCLDAGVPPAGR